MTYDEIPNVILAVDFGSVHTRAVLIEIVEGVYRLAARARTRSTDIFPVNDLAVGFDRVLRQIADATGRRFLSDTGTVVKPEQDDRAGVDCFALTASVGRPLRAALVGLVPEVSLASALRATAGTYIEVVATLSLDDGLSEEDQVNALLMRHPDVILIVGGTEYGAQTAVLRLAETVRMALSLLDTENRPIVIFSGNQALVKKIQDLFGEMTTLLFAENVRPSLDEENLDSARLQLGRAFDRYKERRDESLAIIGAQSDTGISPTAQSYIILAEYLSKVHAGDVALVDMGSSSATLAVTQNGTVINSIRTDLGLGHSARQMLENVGTTQVRTWIPFNIDDADLDNYVLNKSIRPASVPMSLTDLYIEHALLRAGLRTMLLDANPEWKHEPLYLSHAVGAGAALTGTGSPGYDALLLIDALQPSGVTTLRSDPYGLIAAMGAIAVNAPQAVVQLIDENNLVPLGVCITLDGRPRQDKPAMKVKLVADYGREEEIIEETVMGGHLWVYPLPIGRTAQVEVRCLGRTRINGRRRVRLSLEGGLAGLIFDARGRPLPLMTKAQTRAEQFALWVHEVTGDPLLEIDTMLLREVAEGTGEEASQDEKRRDKRQKVSEKPSGKPRRGWFGRGKKAPEKAQKAVSEEPPMPELDDLEDGLDDMLSDLSGLLDEE